jgi:alpha-N-arabinofuranosidase
LKVWLLVLLVAAAFAMVPVEHLSRAQSVESHKATLTIRLDQPRWLINRNIYGQFAEHLGRLIYEGLWVGEQSSIPNTRGCAMTWLQR